MIFIELSWSDRKLEKTCSTDRAAVRAWGADNWKLLKRRLASLSAAPTLSDMRGVPGNCHQLRADRDEEFAVSLWGPYRLIFEPVEPVPRLDDGGIDTGQVTHVRIKEVADYHGK